MRLGRYKISHKKLNETLVFLTKVLALVFPFYLILWYGDLEWLQVLTAQHSAALLQLLGFSVTQSGPILFFEKFDIIVTRDSTAWKSAAFLAALILASRGTWKAKGFGVLAGTAVIYLINLLRMVVISWAAFHGEAAFRLTHDFLWQIGLTAAVLGLWLLWIRRKRILERNFFQSL